MTLRFETLATLAITHEYYGGACRDFDYLLPGDTAARLRAARILARSLDGVLYLLFEADEQGDPRVQPSDLTIRVGLQSLNPHLSNITAAGPGLDGTTALYRNLEDATELDAAVPVTLIGSVLEHPLQAATRPVTVELADADGEIIASSVVGPDTPREVVTFDLRGSEPGPLTATERYTAGPTRKTAYYLHPALASEGVRAVVEIQVDDDFYDDAPAFVIAFEAREERLRYYVVADKYTDAELSSLSVKDQGFTTDGRPEVTFTRVAAGSFGADEIPANILAAGGAKVVLFKSQGDVPRRAQPRRKLELRKQTTVLIDHLPPPGADRTTADVIVHVAKP